MRWLINSSLSIRYLVIVFAVVLMAFGITQLQNMPVDVYPEFNPPLVEVQTEALGLSAAEIEALLTVPMEADLLNGVAWLDEIYSESVVGLSSILLVFEPGTDPIRARQMVQERLTETFALPNVSKPPTMLQPLSTTNRAMMVGISSEELSLIDLGVLARWIIKPRLMGVHGVANVAVWGMREWQLQVQVDPEQLQETGVSLDQVIATTGESLWVSPLSYLESSKPGTAGWIDTPNQRLTVQHILPISRAEDLVKIPVKGTAWGLGDVAEVVEDHQPLIGDTLLRDGPGLLLVVEKFPEANTLEVTRGVEEAFVALAPGLSGVDVDTTVFRPANYIELATSNLGTALLIGAVLVVVALFALLYNWRTALIPAVAISFSLVAATYILFLRGETMNFMVLAGLVMALGAIIDDSILDVENITRRLAQHREAGSDRSSSSIVMEAALEMRGPLGFATLIILLVLLPVFLLQGLTGSFFRPLALSYTLAVVVSFAVALIVTPALSILLLPSGSHKRRESPIMARLQAGYQNMIAKRIQTPRLAYILVVVSVIAGLVLVPFLQGSFLPEFRQTELRILWEGPPGTSLPEMKRITDQAMAELEAVSGVRNIGSHVGRAITGDAVVSINSGEIWITLDPAADYDAALADIRGIVDGYPGFFREVTTYQPDRIDDAFAGASQDIVVRVYGHEFDVLRTKAEEVRQALSGVPGIVDLRADALAEEAQVEIEVDLAAAERFQVKPGDVRRSATTLLSGLQVGNLYEENKVFDVVVWGAPDIRHNLDDIHNLLIDTPRGGHIRLDEVADIRIRPAPIIIKRDAVSRFVDVSANVEGRPLGAVAADVESRLQGISFPLEYHAELLGGVTESSRLDAQRTIGLVVGVVLGIFLILQAAYRSWSMAAAALLTLPMAVSGGLLAVFLAGGVLSLGSLFGLLTVLGIAVRNGLVMVTHFQRLEEQEGENFGPELVVRGARERLTPILTTAVTTALIFVPMLVVGSRAGLEILGPMAVSVLGGLVTSTALSLYVLPALYLRYGARREPVMDLLAAPPMSEGYSAGD